MNVADLIYKSLTTKISPMVYIMMFVNVLIGAFFASGVDMTNADSVLYAAGVLVERHSWGAALLTTATVALYGMARDKRWAVSFGGIAGFMVWLFASISLYMDGYWYVLFTVSLFHMAFNGYVFLANSAGVLKRVTFVKE